MTQEISTPHTTPRRRSSLAYWLIIFVLTAGILISLFFNLLLGTLLFSQSIGSTRTPRVRRHGFEESIVDGRGKNKIVRINMFGIITFTGAESLFIQQEGLATHVIRQIEAAESDPYVKGILLVIDSPGGGVTASDMLYERLRRFKNTEDDRKVVALFRDVAASGGYYVGAAADHIVAHPTTITGSIGVMLSALNLSGLGDKIGVSAVTITSGQNKDLLNPFKPVQASHTNLLQQTVNDLYERFVTVVADSREMPLDDVRPLADGRIYTATQAKENNLIDSIGDYDSAIQILTDLIGVDECTVIEYKRSLSFFDIFSARIAAAIELPVPPVLRTAASTRFMYLWEPSLTE